MMHIFVTDTQGKTLKVAAEVGNKLMETLVNNDYDEIESVCGGMCSCATCHVYVDPQWASALPQQSEQEADLISGLDAKTDNSRLSCQITLSQDMIGMKVSIAAMQD